MKQNSFLAVGVVLALVLGFVGVFTPVGKTIVERTVGGASGPEHTETQQFKAGFSVGNPGGTYATSSTASTYTLTRTEVNVATPYVSWNAGVNTTLTTMASTSAPFSSLAVGESFTQTWYSATTTAAATITFAAGTGVDLQEDEGATVVLNGLEVARVTYLKKADTDIIAWVEVGQVGD